MVPAITTDFYLIMIRSKKNVLTYNYFSRCIIINITLLTKKPYPKNDENKYDLLIINSNKISEFI